MALFARAPAPGRVKTRLIGRLTPQQACDLHRSLVRDAWELLDAWRERAELFLYTDQENVEWRQLAGPALRLQSGGDLGERMLACFDQMRAAGFGPLLILGSDSPVPPIEAWLELLDQAPAGIGPADDGGYYAIGCRAPRAGMFEGVEWSTPRTLEQTMASLERCGMPVALLPRHYDIDTPESLTRLAAEPRLGEHTREWRRRHLS